MNMQLFHNITLILALLTFDTKWTLSHNITSVIEKAPFELDDYLNGTFKNKNWNGTWISDEIFLARDEHLNVFKVIVPELRNELFLLASVFDDFPGNSFAVNSDLKYVLIKYNVNSVFRHSTTAQFAVYDIENKKYYDVANKKHLQAAIWSPVGSSLIYVLDNNIYYIPSPRNISQTVQITKDGIPSILYNGVPDWVYEEEVFSSGSALWFSPDGKRLAFTTIDDRKVPDYHYFMYGTPGSLENQYPEIITIKYPKVGKTNPTVTVKYVNLGTPEKVYTLEKIIPVQYVTKDHILRDVTWATNNDVVAVSLNRIQNTTAITRCNVEKNTCNEIHIFSENRGWIDIKTPIYNKAGSRYITIGSEVEEDDTYKHVVMIDTNSYLKRKRLTFGRKAVLDIFGWDELKDLIYYAATAVEDPSQRHVYSVNTVTLEDKCLTCTLLSPDGLCMYATADFSKSFSYYTRICKGPSPNRVQVVNAETLNFFTWEDNLSLRKQLEKKLLPIKKDFKVIVQGNYTARIRLLLPPNFDENLKYPMIVNVYAGPSSNKITQAFQLGVENYFVTKRNYIYAFIDSRGSGKAGENLMFSVYRKLGTVEVEDQIVITKYLQDNLPYIDSKRTGIWGWSYGGFAATWALIKDTEDVFGFGVAVAPVTNFIYYDSIYTERYMGLPTTNDNLAGYKNSDITRHVEGLRKKKFLLIHGNGDDNVHYQQSMLLAKTLEKADIQFHQQSYPDENHSIQHCLRHLYHTIDNFFHHNIHSKRSDKLKSKKYKRMVKA